jgi:hypothetical protein
VSEIAVTPLTSVKAELRKANASVAGVMKAYDAEVRRTVVEPATTPIPKAPALPEAVYDSYLDLPSVLLDLDLPTSRRQMSPAELKAATVATEKIKAAQAALTTALEQIRMAAFNHFDSVAAEAGLLNVETKLTKEGWAILEDKQSGAVPGLAQKLVREVSGGSPELTEASLHSLEESDEITHDEYLGMTRQVRIVDEARVLEWLRRNPGKTEVLGDVITSKTAPSARLVLRKND